MFELPIKPGVHAFDHFCAHLDRMLAANSEKEFAELANGAVSYETLARDMRRLGVALASPSETASLSPQRMRARR